MSSLVPPPSDELRLMHVADLHIGRMLGDHSRQAEQRALVEELVSHANLAEVHAVLIAGDVFDVYTPPAWAEELFYLLLDGLAAGGERPVFVVAGNHDSGLRLAAARSLVQRLGITIVGAHTDVLRSMGDAASSAWPRSWPRSWSAECVAHQVMRCRWRDQPWVLDVGLLPFVSEAQVGGAAEEDYHAALVRLLGERVVPAQSNPHHQRVLIAHQFVTGAFASDSERTLRIGGLADVDARALPAADYIALGHLHRPQQLHEAPALAAYAGSPLQYSFSETGQQKRAVLLRLRSGQAPVLADLPLRAGRPLEVWRIERVEELGTRLEALRAGAAVRPFVELRLALGRASTRAEIEGVLHAAEIDLVAVRDLFAENRELTSTREGAEALSAVELFSEQWLSQYGEAVDAESLAEFRSALAEVEAGVEAGVGDHVEMGSQLAQPAKDTRP
jgi:exonuclease SbcD